MRSFVPLTCLLLASCQSNWWRPPLEEEPWAMMEPGRMGVSLNPGLVTIYGIDGDFTAETPEGTLNQSDFGRLLGKFGLVARGQVVLTDRLILAGGAEYRRYGIDGLNPLTAGEGTTGPLPEVLVDTVGSMQYFLSLRYLFDVYESQPRLRPWIEVSVAHLPKVDIAFEIDLSEFGTSNVNIDTTGDGYWVGGVSSGLLYQWTDNLTAELGWIYEVPITSLDTDLGFAIGPFDVPMTAELRPHGLLGFAGVTWYL